MVPFSPPTMRERRDCGDSCCHLGHDMPLTRWTAEWKGEGRTRRDEDDSTSLMRDTGHQEERIRSFAQV